MSAASGADTAGVQCAGKATQVDDAGTSQGLDDRQHVCRKGIGIAHERSRAGRGRLAEVSPINVRTWCGGGTRSGREPEAEMMGEYELASAGGVRNENTGPLAATPVSAPA